MREQEQKGEFAQGVDEIKERAVVMTKRALISVTDKTNLHILLKALEICGYEVISTGGTARALQTIVNENNLKVKIIDVSSVTDFPEVFRGRLKSIHPLIEGAILFDPSHPGDQEEARKVGITPISLVVCNFYKFENLENLDEEEVIERMDIGGPTMTISAIKNYKSVGVIVDFNDYGKVGTALIENNGELPLSLKKDLAVKAVNYLADYRANNAVVLSKILGNELVFREKWVKGKQIDPYGENWHQDAWIYQEVNPKGPSVAVSKQLHGAPMSYNNYVDAAAALEAVTEYSDPCCAVIKHNNPCGFATGKNLVIALERAWQGDPVSAFGSVLAFNRDVGLDVMKALSERVNFQGKLGWFVEAIIAPAFTQEALDYIRGLKTKERMRLVAVGHLDKEREPLELKNIPGGLLKQTRDNDLFLARNIRSLIRPAYEMLDKRNNVKRLVGVVTHKVPPIDNEGLFKFVWIAAKHTKSNAVVVAREYDKGFYQVIGMGAGQPNRKDAGGKLAKSKARENLALEYNIITGKAPQFCKEIIASEMPYFETWAGALNHITVDEYIKRELEIKCAVASDAFFPFKDGIEEVADLGVKMIIQPGGSKRDDEVIAAANSYGMSMVFTGMRHFRH